MKSLTIDPFKDTVTVRTESSVLDALLARELKVPMMCGGKGFCSTCHVWVEEGMDKLTPMTPREKMTLGLVSGATMKSRLSCQAKVLGDGVRVLVPNVQYVETSGDLLSLVGKRATKPICHPIDGRVLVEKDKIITKTRILELEKVDHDVAEMRQKIQTL